MVLNLNRFSKEACNVGFDSGVLDVVCVGSRGGHRRRIRSQTVPKSFLILINFNDRQADQDSAHESLNSFVNARLKVGPSGTGEALGDSSSESIRICDPGHVHFAVDVGTLTHIAFLSG